MKTSSLLFCATILYSSCNYADEPSIKSPGADMANFPNGSFTLSQGNAYLEAGGNYNSKSTYSPEQYNAGYLLRYGLTDNIELRVMSDGYTFVHDEAKTQGMSPQTFDIKWHLIDENDFLPSLAVEFGTQTTWASDNFKDSTLPFLGLNFDHSLPFDVALNYSVGFDSQLDDNGNKEYLLALGWAFQREVVEDVAVFVDGYTNTAAGLTTSAIGGGGQWTPTERISIFTNVAAGLTESTPSIYALLGFAVAVF
ncbi:MAG: transporter [Methylococcaceae bacterium]